MVRKSGRGGVLRGEAPRFHPACAKPASSGRAQVEAKDLGRVYRGPDAATPRIRGGRFFDCVFMELCNL